MYPPSKQFQAPSDEEDQPEEDGDNGKSKDAVIKELGQETFYSYHYQHFGQVQDFPQNPKKINYEREMQENLNISSVPKSKAKQRKSEIIEVHGGRIVYSTGRKDRHSKVCTARGPKDRRVRLSPRTAIQFYDVQDRLGYDRPSKAIDWLIKEAKAAIDALDEHPPFSSAENHRPPNGKVKQMQEETGRFLISELGMTQKNEHFEDCFSFFVDGAAPGYDFDPLRTRSEGPEEAMIYPSYQQGFSPVLATTSQILNTNWEMAKLQKNLASDNARGGGGAYSSVNSPAIHFPVQPVLGHSQMFSQREPLQSSTINYSPISTHLSGFNFSNELSNITAGATLKEDGKDTKPVFSRPSPTAPFLHYQD